MTFINYVENLKRNARKENIKILREEIDLPWVKKKIKTFTNLWDNMFTESDVREQILTNDIVAAKFIKDPTRQNMGEMAVTRLLGADTKLGSNDVRFTSKGEMISGPAQTGCTKSADYLVNGVYYTQKFTTGSGGGQGSAYHDVVEFLEKGSIFYQVGAIVDGTYWDINRDSLKLYFANNNNVSVLSMDDIKQYSEE